MNFKEIHIGQIIENAVTESGIEISRICNFLKCTEKEIEDMYQSKSLDSDNILKWSKLLKYDFFRIYSQHLILYSPPLAEPASKQGKSNLPKFRKNIYTKEIIGFILEQLDTQEMTKKEVMERYKIPKTTLVKWINKYK